jgi:hypothetical protein
VVCMGNEEARSQVEEFLCNVDSCNCSSRLGKPGFINCGHQGAYC